MVQFMLPVFAGRGSKGLWLDLLKLSIPSMVMWLLMFYTLFHCYLNIVAELTMYADRAFYHKWYNATTLKRFWADWNQPVHEFCLRHLYIDVVKYGNVGKEYALLGTFLISAVLHELIFSVAFKTVRGWFFGGMLLQVPLIMLSQQLRGTRRGNLTVWLSLFLGQPLLELLYIREYLAEHESFFCVAG